ncbi:hypothetical protein MHLP_02075 [Candidatus Mycoplasma haematolamae str. Purdue]|uniref:Uncharacterized protein n=1 Tax=Mycoplasma haematolamae (strain Purdue) TaxID=1212765 RepID=I7B9R2_MYCHA|nr:hypothetical protein [Candidatus Mycoplasma haematolamae]AFO51995.1 hypothetical protein MHLP_02075 [Candidatus Mycoplasma haematolamae str. Purdue]
MILPAMKSIFLSIAGFNVAAGGVGAISYLLINKESRKLLDKSSATEEKDASIEIDSQGEGGPKQSLLTHVRIEDLSRQDQPLVDEDSENEDYL